MSFHPRSQRNLIEFIKLLLNYGADPFIKNYKGKLPIDYCNGYRDKNACKLLKEVMDQSKLLQIYSTQKGHLNKFPTDLGPKIFNYMFGLHRSKTKQRL